MQRTKKNFAWRQPIASNPLTLGINFLSGFVKKPDEKNLINREIPIRFRDNSNLRLKIISPLHMLHPSNPTIIILHGMNKLGIDDPRILNLAKCTARLGFRVLVPEIPEITNLEITEKTLNSIVDRISMIVDEPEYTTERLGFLSISFSGGMGLIAISRPELRDRFNSIATIGAYADFKSTIPFVLENFDKDNYGTYIFLYNFINLFQMNSSNLKIYFYQAAMDNGLKRTGSSAVSPKIFEILSDEDKEFCRQIEKNIHTRKEVLENLMKNSKSLLDLLSPINYMERISSRVSLIHGKGDCIIPESESILLANKLKSLEKPFRLEITKLLDHGDTLPIWKQIPELPGLALAFGYFFSNI